ncbi:MAG TPA: ATP-binding domain-containing protein [Streptosporangiaceae bacterium]|jgi:DNA helicase IV|nr:ATP-binding domain-containing protein [Streptosporangiaceae bacterium]
MTLSQTNSAGPTAVDQEQAYLDMLYRLLDRARARTERALTQTHGRGTAGGTFQARIEREVTAAEQGRRLAQLNAVEHGLCFGRTDADPAEVDGASEHAATLYIGRIGLRDDEHEPRLIDWRAPAAHPFYAATPKDPNGLIRRRHIYTRNRAVVGVDDEVFDLDRLSEPDRKSLSGEAMLIASITAGRTGRMSDVVATIQAEQDRVIRATLQGVLVVQGGPGTGKTVAALHRAAYLLYTHRKTLERRGVLVIGPNATFLRYISQVLPSLGETDVVLSSIAELFPGVKAAAEEAPDAAVVKGDIKMVNVLRRAVRDAQRVPPGDLEITVDGLAMTVPADRVRRARDRARGLRKPHNVARKAFATEMLSALAVAEAAALGRELDPEDIPYTRARLWDEPPVRAAVDALWPFLTPQRLVAGLLGEEGALRRAAPGLSEAERAAVLRPGHLDAWTVADVPLLDEAAQLIGTDDSADKARRRAADRERRATERYAREVLEINGLAGQGFVDAATLADWNRDQGQQLTTAERAWADPSWAYGHVIVDEAQELSAMAWRMVMRRIPTRSLTVVGDVAQRGSPAGARSWAEVLDPYVADRWHEELLTVNYRTPAEIMAVAADVLASVAPGELPPESVREEGVFPHAVRGLALAPGVVAGELAEMGKGGRLAVIAPRSRIAELARALPAAVTGDRAEALDSPVALLTVNQSKGLEFDRVVLVDPAGILAQSPVGGHDLYVAITRATHRLTVVYDADLPAALHRLAS